MKLKTIHQDPLDLPFHNLTEKKRVAHPLTAQRPVGREAGGREEAAP